jgi:hypothetical protein
MALLDQDIDTANQTVLSQRERCQEEFLATRDSLLESLDPQSAKSVVEASSLLGRKWLSVIPFSPALRLTDLEVSADPTRYGWRREGGDASSRVHRRGERMCMCMRIE